MTELPTLSIGDNFALLMDGGCYHMIPASKRDAYARSVSAVAATGATLIMVGFTRHLAFGMGRDELIKRFVGWQLVDAQPIPGEQMHQYISGPQLMRTALRHGRFVPGATDSSAPDRALHASFTGQISMCLRIVNWICGC